MPVLRYQQLQARPAFLHHPDKSILALFIKNNSGTFCFIYQIPEFIVRQLLVERYDDPGAAYRAEIADAPHIRGLAYHRDPAVLHAVGDQRRTHGIHIVKDLAVCYRFVRPFFEFSVKCDTVAVKFCTGLQHLLYIYYRSVGQMLDSRPLVIYLTLYQRLRPLPVLCLHSCVLFL